jgi:hypothetical protein
VKQEDFGFETKGVVAADYHISKDERPRLSGQCERILALLERGPVTNRRLAEIALKYTSRISDIRAYFKEIGRTDKIDIINKCHKTGLRIYELHQV